MSQIDLPDPSEVSPAQNRLKNMQFKGRRSRAQLEDYDLHEQIGEGGYGRVRRAVHRPTGQVVAVKVLKVGEAGEAAEVEAEIALQQRLLHEHIAQVYEVVRRERKIYIFMEHCPNGELFERIVKGGPMAEKEAARVFLQILSALLYLKRMGVSHRDIKPENVLFDGEWNVKLVDFGFGCSNAEDRLRRTLCGTPSYTPPEVLLRAEYSSELMDVWSLGVTLYTMLAAEMPFEGESPEKRRARILGCRWTPKPFFSPRATRLLASLFVEPSRRPLLADLQASEFAQAYPLAEAAFVDPGRENLVPEEGVLAAVEREYGLAARKVSESVRGYCLDRSRAHYYLTLAKMGSGAGLLPGTLSKYKKARKSSASKLDPIARTPFKPAHTPREEKGENLRIRRGSVNLEAPTIRVRKERTPESPRKLRSSLALYE